MPNGWYMNKTLLIFEAAPGSDYDWRCVNDGVMGGRSESSIQLYPDGKLRWHGHLSLASGGGFASLRLRTPALDVSAYTGLRLRLRGDGKTYKLNLANSESSAAPRFQQRFATDGSAQQLKLPFDKLEASFRGRRVDAAFDPGHLLLTGFLLADRQAGPFELIIERIEAYVD
jgi:monofunctional biosynthetic peptidoglycan transglycosylase